MNLNMFEFYEQIAGDINDTTEPLDAPATSGTHRPAGIRRSDAHVLEQRIERLSLACAAMWNLLKQQTGMSDAQLMEAMTEIDLQDGVADGKVSRGPARCPQCNRPNARRHSKCLYCGTALHVDPF